VLSGKERLGKCPRCKRERPLTKSNPYKPEEWVCTSCAATLRKWKREGRVYVCPEPDAPDEATAA
jgi:transposase-like protein